MNVLQLISSGGYYGAESMLLNLCAGQESDRTGCHSTLALFYNLRQPSLELCQHAQRSGLSVRMVRCRGRADWRALREIRQYIRADSADLVHTHGYKADLYGYLAARVEGKPVVATCHNWVGGTAALRIYNRLDRMVLRKFSAIAAVSGDVARNLLASGIAAGRIRTIANGISVEGFAGAQPASFPGIDSSCGKVIGMVARLDLQKGFEYLLLAVRELCRSFAGIRVIIAGDGPDRAAIQSMVRNFGLQSHVLLAGQRHDMPAVYAAMDIFVLPSLNEGLPMTVLEAMASARPVIATRVGAVPCVVRDGETGLLVEPRDAAGLATAISRLLADPDLGRRLGVRAREWVQQNYSSDAMARKYRQMYDEVLAGANNASAAQSQPLKARDARTGNL